MYRKNAVLSESKTDVNEEHRTGSPFIIPDVLLRRTEEAIEQIGVSQ